MNVIETKSYSLVFDVEMQKYFKVPVRQKKKDFMTNITATND